MKPSETTDIPHEMDQGDLPYFKHHFLLDCPGLNASRRLFYEVTTLKDMFNGIMPEKVLDFFYHMLI